MNQFTDMPVGKLYAKFLPSAIVALLISSVASLIDTVVVSAYMGPVALSAVNICMPIYSILTAVGLLIIGGASTYYSKYLGAGEKDKANKIYTLAFVVITAIGIAYSLFGVFCTDGIVRFLGANDSVFDMSKSYARVLFYFATINILFPFLQSFLRIDMDPRRTVVAIVATAATNLVLDILFVGPFGWGTTGAAYATSIAYCVGFVIMIMHFLKKSNTLKFAKNFFSLKEFGKMLISGLPGSITLFGTAITLTVFNNFIIVNGNNYGVGVGELYVSVYSVIVQVLTISMAFYVGVAQCAQPIFAANIGAKRYDRVKELFKKGLIIETIGNVVLVVLFYFVAGGIAKAFNMAGGTYDMTDVAIIAIRVFSISLVFTGVNQMIQYLLQTSGEVLQSSIISFLSGTLLLIVGLYALAGGIFKGNENALGVWLSYTFAQGLTMIYALIVYFVKRKKLFHEGNI